MFSMTPEEFQELREKRELHSFILLMSTEAYHAENFRDFLLRLGMAVLALAAVTGLGLAWRNIERSGGLQLRLVRASEMNVHLREMNIAAAGLAHETRNPLNIVRGLAQMIGKSTGVSSEIRSQSVEITEEVDRVTSRLNEFIDYSKPQEAKPAPTNLNAIIQDVERTLESDQQEKGIQFELHGPELTVEADEGLLRQVLFNLLLNSIQAVDQDGRIEVHVQKVGASEAALEICDNGPGVPAEARDNIFRPYFTTTKGGAGLGLAVVRQIVLAHRWEINYLPGDSGGSRFRISGLKLA